MASLVNYKGLQILSPNPTGDGGLAIQDNFTRLADWQPYSVWDESSSPTPSDDDTEYFYPGSWWLQTNVTPPQLYVCVSSATGAAVWEMVSDRIYVQSRGMNLVTNGLGLMGDNTNFIDLTFDPVDVFAGAGSFLWSSSTYLQEFSSELIPVDLSRTYLLSLWAKSGNLDGSNYNSDNIQYFGVAEYDIDGNSIWDYQNLKYPGAQDTTLAATLNPGDTTVTLTDATGWSINPAGYSRNMAWYPYSNAKGYTYPDYTYTRNTTLPMSDFNANGLWATTGISGNTITLRTPWSGPTLATGTSVRNLTSGWTYKYIAAILLAVPNEWTYYSGSIGGVAPVSSATPINSFWTATAYVTVVLLLNHPGPPPTPVNYIRVSGINLSDITMDQAAYPLAVIPNPPTAGVLVYGRNIANRPLLGMRGPALRSPTIIQPHAAFTRQMHIVPDDGGNITTFGIPNTVVGTVTTPVIATTNDVTYHTRSVLTSAASANSSAEQYSARLLCCLGSVNTGLGGFLYTCRFSVNTSTADQQVFIGLLASTSAIATNQQPSDLTNCIGIGWDSADSNLQIIYNSGSGSATKIDLGSGFLANATTSVFEITFSSYPADPVVGYRLVKWDDQTETSGTLSSNLPAATTLLTRHEYINNGGTAAAAGIALMNVYLELP